MPSFDIVSEFDKHELTNAIDQASREVNTRFDFKGTGSSFAQDGNAVTMTSQSEFQLQQMLDILQSKLTNRGIDISCLDVKDAEIHLSNATQLVVLREGIESELAKKIVKMIKEKKLKVQAQIQGEQVRVTGKKRDDLQEVIALLKSSDLGLPLQFTNFRD